MFSSSLALSKQLGNHFMMGENERHIGYQHYFSGDTKNALVYFRKSLDSRKSIGYTDGQIFARITLAQILGETGNDRRALSLLKQAIKDSRSINSNLGLARALLLKARILHAKGQTKHLKKILNECIDISEFIDYRSVDSAATELLNEIS